METALVKARLLAQHIDDPEWVVVDCRFALADTELGRRQYAEGHIPGSVYAHLDKDLSGKIVPGKTSRHPLPEIEKFVETLSNWGIGDGVQVVVYDDSGGAIAARLWWMLHWLGHDAAAVLDGGWTEWMRQGLPISADIRIPTRRKFKAQPRPELLASDEEVMTMRSIPQNILVDARDPERYRGEVEPIDSAAGHIPGATNLPYKGNLDAAGKFLPRERLRERYEKHLGDRRAHQAVFYCGSGVTAAHSILAMAYAGLGEGKLYAPSWSGWIADGAREIQTGESGG